MKAIFPETIDGDLLKLVHLSNAFRVVSGSKPLAAGDVCQAEASVVAVINNDSGKVVKVKGHVLRDGKPVMHRDDGSEREGAGGWISNIVKRDKSDAGGSRGRYERLGRDEDEDR